MKNPSQKTENRLESDQLNPIMVVLGFQHAMAMFGATVLFPLLTGMSTSVTLFTSGVGTLLFYLITKGKVPVYLGSSFAFIAPIFFVINQGGGVAAAQGGIMAAGLVYVLVSLLLYLAGPEKIEHFFPPVVTGPVILIIGLMLARIAVEMASEGWGLALVALSLAGGVSIFCKGFFRLIPVLTGLLGGFLASMATGTVDLTAVREAAWLGMPPFTAPILEWSAIAIIAPVALVTLVEHAGDILAIGATVGKGKQYLKDPGIHRTMLGDGLATALAGFLGGPPNTTYSENTGVLAYTRVYHPVIMCLAACFAIMMAFLPKLGVLIRTIPTPVVGGITILLTGIIAGVGIRTMIENQIDLSNPRNLFIAGFILVMGIGGAEITVFHVSISGVALAGISGLILNQILPVRR